MNLEQLLARVAQRERNAIFISAAAVARSRIRMAEEPTLRPIRVNSPRNCLA